MPAFNFIDRRLNPKGKSLPNQQRFQRLLKEEIREAVERAIGSQPIKDIGQGGVEVKVKPKKDLSEPRFRHSSTGGDRDIVLPGNKEFVQGDTLDKPKTGAGEKGSQGSPDGEGEDEFRFLISQEEYLDILFANMELPDMARKFLKDADETAWRRAGHASTGSPSNTNLVRTMRQSLARRISLRRPRKEDFEAVQTKIRQLEETDLTAKSAEDIAAHELKLVTARAELDALTARSKRIAYIDPVDLRYNRFEPKPVPNAQAVMFCLMDVSSSMNEDMKDLAKRFYVLLHLFLKRNYKKVDIVFIRHTNEAKEVDEDTFFHSKETGGTVVSSALEEMLRITAARYPTQEWNIYASQVSDGDNLTTDNKKCISLLQEQIISLVQYYAYVEVKSKHFTNTNQMSDLWKAYAPLATQHVGHFAMQIVANRAEVFPVFHDLFAKKQHNPAALGLG